MNCTEHISTKFFGISYLRTMSETEWGVCRESSRDPLASLELPCQWASISAAEVSDVGSVTPGAAPGLSGKIP